MHDPGPYDGHPSSPPDEIICRQFVELVTDYFEGTLDRPTLNQVEEHLVICDWCVAYADQMQTVVSMLHELKEEPPTEPSDGLLIALLARRQD